MWGHLTPARGRSSEARSYFLISQYQRPGVSWGRNLDYHWNVHLDESVFACETPPDPPPPWPRPCLWLTGLTPGGLNTIEMSSWTGWTRLRHTSSEFTRRSSGLSLCWRWSAAALGDVVWQWHHQGLCGSEPVCLLEFSFGLRRLFSLEPPWHFLVSPAHFVFPLLLLLAFLFFCAQK